LIEYWYWIVIEINFSVSIDKDTSLVIPNFSKISLKHVDFWLSTLIFYINCCLTTYIREIILRPILEGDLYQRATYTRINTVIELSKTWNFSDPNVFGTSFVFIRRPQLNFGKKFKCRNLIFIMLKLCTIFYEIQFWLFLEQPWYLAPNWVKLLSSILTTFYFITSITAHRV